MVKIKCTDTLVWYDSPQVFEGEDETGQRYIGVLGASETMRDLVVGVTEGKRQAFLDGRTDLRSVIAESSPKERYTTSTIPDENGSSKLALEPFNERPTEKEFLPAPGFRITENRTG